MRNTRELTGCGRRGCEPPRISSAERPRSARDCPMTGTQRRTTAKEYTGAGMTRLRQADGLKKYCSLIHGEPVIEATMDLRRRYNLVEAEVERVRRDTFQAGYDFAGGGNYGSKDHPWHKEQGDYNLKYLISAALLDGQVGPAQLTEERVQAPDAQPMVARIECRPDAAAHSSFPARAECPHHRSHERWPGAGGGAYRLRGRAG